MVVGDLEMRVRINSTLRSCSRYGSLQMFFVQEKMHAVPIRDSSMHLMHTEALRRVGWGSLATKLDQTYPLFHSSSITKQKVLHCLFLHLPFGEQTSGATLGTFVCVQVYKLQQNGNECTREFKFSIRKGAYC